ncbi:MAG: bile acid:sodium symporter family protein [Gemmatimonadales bacterium]
MAILLPLLLKASLALLVISLGLSATLQDITYLLRRPGQLARALLAMFVIMPVTALILARAFDPPAAVKIALVALALSPLPPTFSRKALKQGGSLSYVAGLLLAATLVAVPLIPLSLELIERNRDLPLQMRPAAVLAVVFWSLLLPLAAGMVIRKVAPAFAQRASGPISTIAFAVLVLGVIPIFIRVWPAIVSLVGNGTLLVMVLLALVGLAAGHILGAPDPENRTVLALSTATRHPAVAIAIAQANFPDHKLAPAAVLLYVVVSVIAGMAYLKWAKRRHVAAPVPARS